MTYSKILLAVFMGCFSLFLLSSCTKDDSKVSNVINDTSSEIRASTPGSSSGATNVNFDFPAVNGDHYSFRDYDHLTKYYQSLDVIYSEDDKEFNDFVSLSSRGVNTVHNKLINDVFENPRDRYQPFLTDPIMMAIVNEHFEFEVDNVLITYMNNSDLLICDPNDSVTKNAIRTLSCKFRSN